MGQSGKLNPASNGIALKLTIIGKPAATPDVVDDRTFAVRIGDRIQVKYRPGKSGAVYIDDWQPLAR